MILPWPPSANRLWRSVNGRNIKSAVYRAWLTEAAYALRGHPAYLGPYTMTLTATRPDRRRRDLSNLLKAVEDSLQTAGIIEDDSLAQSILLQWSPAPPVPSGRLEVTITPAHEQRAAA